MAQGYKSGHIFQISLETSAAAEAIAKAEDLNRWLESGGQGPTKQFNSLSQLYDSLHAQHKAAQPDERYGIRPPLLNPDLDDAIQQGSLSPDDLNETDRAAFFASREVDAGRARPAKYLYSLRDCLADFRKQKGGTVTSKTLNAHDRAVSVYLGKRNDIALDLIRSPDVALWLDSLVSTTAYGTRSDHTNRLKAMYIFAQKRGHVDGERRNPFEDQDLGKNDKTPVTLMSDGQLLAILAEMRSEIDRLPAIIARHSGMRLGEIFNSKLETVDGLLCFVIQETEEGWTPKTTAGLRTVPVRKSIQDLVLKHHSSLGSPVSYSKKFTRIKKKLFPDTERELVFHSLRKTFITLALQAGHSTEHVAHLCGHEEGKGNPMTGRLYMGGHKISFLSEIVESVEPLANL